MNKQNEGRSLFTQFFKAPQSVGAQLLILSLLSSCLLEPTQSGAGRTQGGIGAGIDNSQESVSTGNGRILEDNPIILSGNETLEFDVNLATLLTQRQEFITDRQFLEGECFNISGICFEVREDDVTEKFQSKSRKWAYPTDSTEFLQVNTFGHLKRIIETYHDTARDIFFNRTQQASPPSTIDYKTSLPGDLYLEESHWRGNLVTFADSGLEDNAFYSPAGFQIGLGEDSIFSELKFGHDPTVIYHEIGHALNDIMLNFRNNNSQRLSLPKLFYDEGGAINEGIADYYSYVMNQRPHMGEWALGRYINQSRPLKETDAIHAPGISTTRQGRLSYPSFVNYDPNRPEGNFEEIHYAGQIISHYLVALTEMFKQKCQLNHKGATRAVIHILMETLSEFGDLESRGSDHNTSGQVNLNDNPNTQLTELNSQTWNRIANPINFRKFAQLMAWYQNEIYGNSSSNRCNGGVLEKDDIEKLLDDYGLLLFRTYNDNRNDLVIGSANREVEVSNRLKSSLVKKNAIKLEERTGKPVAFVFDDRATLVDALEQLNSSGQLKDSLSTQIESDLPYNNGNISISPGEFVGLALNLYNDSNSTLAGVEVLANDWDHTSDGKLCNNLGDNFPAQSEGGVSGGDCETVTRDNGGDGDEIAPICYVQSLDGGSTTWVSQNDYKNSISGMNDSQCLDPQNPENCFIRFPRGADHAVYSRIDSGKTFAETLINSNGEPAFNISNLLFMEVNRDIPPGTTFNCRFRVRFTNCDDCYHDSDNDNDDYEDYEFAGHRPFKIINYQFEVID